MPPPFVGSDYYCETGDNDNTCCANNFYSNDWTVGCTHVTVVPGVGGQPSGLTPTVAVVAGCQEHSVLHTGTELLSSVWTTRVLSTWTLILHKGSLQTIDLH